MTTKDDGAAGTTRHTERTLIDQVHDLLEPELGKSSDQHHQQARSFYQYYSERHLAAWVVARRLPPDELAQTWKLHGNQMVDWSIRILHCMQQKNHVPTSLQEFSSLGGDVDGDVFRQDLCILRLIVQVTSSTMILPPPSPSPAAIRNEAVINSDNISLDNLVNVVLDTWTRLVMIKIEDRHICSTDLKVLKLSIDVGNFVLHWMSQQRSQDPENLPSNSDDRSSSMKLVSKAMGTVWDVFEKRDGEFQSTTTTGNSHNGANHETIDETSNEHEMMIQLLDTILDDSNETNEFGQLSEIWQQIVISILNLGRSSASEELASQILLWTTTLSSSSSSYHQHGQMKRRVDEWIMTYIMGRCNKNKNNHLRNQSDTAPSKMCKMMIMYEPQTTSAIEQMLLAYVVSPMKMDGYQSNQDVDDDDEVYRAMAWQTIVSIVETYGWRVWKNSTKQLHGEAGLPSKPSIIKWTQLATGEYKIQLEQALSESSTRPKLAQPESPNSSSSHSKLTLHGSQKNNREMILDGCTRLLINVVEYLTSLDYSLDERTLSKKCSGILEPTDYTSLAILKESLEATLFTTSQYVTIINQEEEQKMQDNHETQALSDGSSNQNEGHSSFRANPMLLPVVSLWSHVFAETDMFSMDADNATEVVECFKILLGWIRKWSTEPTSMTGKDNDSENFASVTLVAALLPAVAQFLSSLDGNLINQRKMASVIESGVIPFLVDVWICLSDRCHGQHWWTDRNDDGMTVLSWACTCVELLTSLSVVVYSKQHVSIEKSMIECMKSAIEYYNNDSTTSLSKISIGPSLNQLKESFLSLIEDSTTSGNHNGGSSSSSSSTSFIISTTPTNTKTAVSGVMVGQEEQRPTPEELQVLAEASKIILLIS